ncbi:MAG: glycosyl transferase family 36, partial [Spirochaetes bacterium]|nr:glycosyl transferase family 36 [Spirochaetota bacterium]
MKGKRNYETKYGYFETDGSYFLKTPITPKPWINVISNGLYSTMLSQTGGGFSWYIHSNFNRITRWFQDVIRDDWGKYVYLKDNHNKKFHSLTFQPTRLDPKFYKIRHSFGYSQFLSVYNDLETEMNVFVPLDHSLEIWKIKVKNLTLAKRDLSLFTYFEWQLGDAPDTHREFFKTFIETEFEDNTILAFKRMWNLKNKKGEHFNRPWEYIAYHFSNRTVASFDTEKENFIGKYGDLKEPRALTEGGLKRQTGKWNDPIGSLMINIILNPGEEQEVVFVLGLDKKRKNISKVKEYFSDRKNVNKELGRCIRFWSDQFERASVNTPDDSLNLLVNQWLKYQAISCRIWGRAAFYQQSGAYGFRDQLQ